MPADWLVRQGIAFTLTDEAAAMNRFEKLFTDFNKLLEPTAEREPLEVVTTVGKRVGTRR
jgi:hypothetical protein